MPQKILVPGATGKVGPPLAQALLNKGVQVKVASRSGKSLAGAEAVVFDYARPATIPAPFEGVDRADVMLPAGDVNQQELLLPVIQAAAERHRQVLVGGQLRRLGSRAKSRDLKVKHLEN